MAKDNRPPGRIEEKDYISEVVAGLVFIGRACAGCLKPIGMSPNLEHEGIPCFCIDELVGALAEAHRRIRWCSEECLHRTHEQPSWPKIGDRDISVK